MTDLKQHTIHALKWNFLGTVGAQAIQFVITVVLARLLIPAQLGLVAMLSLFMAVAASITDSGFECVLIQKQHSSLQDESSIFYFNIVISFLMYVLLWMCAPWFATFFSEPLLIPLSRFIALAVIVKS